jgi:4-hydroxy-tetrahydrodipicolinate synthase
MEFIKSESKQWAKKNLKGLEAVIFPSFTPNLAELDEEGIRYDVQHLAKNGFTSALCAVEACGMTFEERKKFVEIVCHEAKGKMHTSMTILQDTVEQDIEMLKHFEKVGGDFVTLGHPVQYYPRSVEDIYRMYKYMCDSTNLGIIFYPGRLHTRKFHPSDWPISLLTRIADIPNVVGMKIGGGNSLAFTAQCFHLIGDKILVNDPLMDRWPLTIPKCGQQWAGAGPFYMFQTPENPRVVRMFELFLKGDINKAMDIYWEIAPIIDASGAVLGQVSYYDTGIVCAPIDKYFHWCNGGNGGMVRQPTCRIHDYHKERIKASLRAGGLTPREAPEEEFYVGRVNYAKGARLKNYEAVN